MKMVLSDDGTTTSSSQHVTIDITRTDIEYDASVDHQVQYVDTNVSLVKSPHGDTLLHLLAYLIYTAEGRTLLKKNRPSGWQGSLTPDQLRGRIKAALVLKFPTIADDVIAVVIDLHFAADGYVAASNAHDDTREKEQEGIYVQKLLAILGALHDDALGHEFSMAW
jgi:hypothetical protein